MMRRLGFDLEMIRNIFYKDYKANSLKKTHGMFVHFWDNGELMTSSLRRVIR